MYRICNDCGGKGFATHPYAGENCQACAGTGEDTRDTWPRAIRFGLVVAAFMAFCIHMQFG